MAGLHEEDVTSRVVVHLDVSLRAEMEAYSRKAGETLDTFISTAGTELIRRRKAEEWYAKPRQSTADGRAKALELLNRPSGHSPLPGDELPEGINR